MTSSNEGTYNFKNEEFQEEDIWGTNNNSVIEKNQLSSKFITSKDQPLFTLNPRRQIPTAAKIMIPKSNKNSIQEFKIIQHSAPVTIPDWSKIYGKSLKKDIGNFVTNNSWESDEEIEENDEENMVPPHEWLAKRLGRNQISSFSVCEGVGRTLKGRDLSRVRNAVLTKTGFLE